MKLLKSELGSMWMLGWEAGLGVPCLGVPYSRPPAGALLYWESEGLL